MSPTVSVAMLESLSLAVTVTFPSMPSPKVTGAGHDAIPLPPTPSSHVNVAVGGPEATFHQPLAGRAGVIDTVSAGGSPSGGGTTEYVRVATVVLPATSAAVAVNVWSPSAVE